MKYFFIFALFLIACSDVNERCPTFEVTISDALPIQFWLADCETYNEKEVCGVHHKCWCQPWNCDDELTIQFADDSLSEYVLRVVNSNDEAIDEVEFIPTEFTEDPFSDLPFTGWNNVAKGDGNAWTIDSTPSVSISTSLATEDSDYIRRPIVLPAGSYQIDYDIDSGGGGAVVYFWIFRKDGITVGSGNRGSFLSSSINITLTDDCDEILFYVGVSSFETRTITINEMFQSIVVLREPIFTANYTPSNASPVVCGEQVSFQIVDVSSSPEVIVAKSDCINIMPDHNCTTLIEYSNNRNFAGLVYEDVSPAQSFKTRVPAIFFHERFPEEDNVIELSESIVHTSGQVKAQRLFETDYMPYYMHRKLQLIFKQQNIFIENQYWTKEEPYEVQDGERRWPAKKVKCFLTEKNYVQRAVL